MTVTRSETRRGRLVLALVATAAVTALAVLAIVAAVLAGGGGANDVADDVADDSAVDAEDGVADDPVCTVSDLPGTVVTVFLTDMGLEADGQHGRMTSGTAMFLSPEPAGVADGTVTFLAINGGRLTHELILLPLADGENDGELPIGEGSMVAEAGFLAEASTACGDGPGDGILPDTSSWVTITLPPGRYELLCNLPGHYAAGMHAEFTVG